MIPKFLTFPVFYTKIGNRSQFMEQGWACEVKI